MIIFVLPDRTTSERGRRASQQKLCPPGWGSNSIVPLTCAMSVQSLDPSFGGGGGHIVAMSVISMVSFRCAESAHGVTREEELAPPMAGPQLLGISLPQGSRLRVITGE